MVRYSFMLARPAGIAMPPVDICFTDDFLFLTVAPLIRQWMHRSQRGSCVNTVDEKLNI